MDTSSVPQSDGDNRHTLLVIDDDSEWTDLIQYYFTDKYRVLVANFAADAMAMIDKQRPSIIIVDLVMPSIDGFGILRRLSDMKQEQIPTILLTGWKSPEVEECAASIGCAVVLSKPILLPELDDVVSSVVNGKAASATVGAL